MQKKNSISSVLFCYYYFTIYFSSILVVELNQKLSTTSYGLPQDERFGITSDLNLVLKCLLFFHTFKSLFLCFYIVSALMSL